MVNVHSIPYTFKFEWKPSKKIKKTRKTSTTKRNTITPATSNRPSFQINPVATNVQEQDKLSYTFEWKLPLIEPTTNSTPISPGGFSFLNEYTINQPKPSEDIYQVANDYTDIGFQRFLQLKETMKDTGKFLIFIANGCIVIVDPQRQHWEHLLEEQKKKDDLLDDEQRILVERLQFFVIPFGPSENAVSIVPPSRSMEYMLGRVEEAEWLMQKRVLLRMNPDSSNQVTYRQNLIFTLPAGEIAELFIKRRKDSAMPISEHTNTKTYYLEGRRSQGINITSHVYTWKDDELGHKLPTLATPYWYLKKWETPTKVVFRAHCTQFTLVYRPEIDTIRVEMEYNCEFFNPKINGTKGAWQFC